MADVVVERLITQLVFDGDVKEYERAESAVAGLATAAFAAAAALAGLAASTAAEIGVFQRLGEGLGLGTQGAREMAAVFAITGAEINDVSDALQTLSDYSLEAANGNKTWVDTFRQIGVAAADLRGKKPDELLSIVADGFERTTDVTKRAAVASQLFGDDVGRKLLPMLMKGSEGIKALREEASAFGGVLTEEDAKAAQALNTDLRRLGYTVDGIRVRLGVALIPVLREVTHDVLEWMAANKEWLNLKIGQGIDVLTTAFKDLTSPLGLVVVGFGGLMAAKSAAGAISKLAVALGFAEGGIGAALAPLALPAGVLLLTVAGVEDLVSAAQGGPSVLGELAGAIGVKSEFYAALGATRTMLQEASDFAWSLGDALQALLPDLSAIGDYLPDLDVAGALVATRDAANRWAGGYQRAGAALRSGDPSALGKVAQSAGQALVNPYGITASNLNAGYDLAAQAAAPIESLRYGGGWADGGVTVNVNANGLSASEAEAMTRRVIQTEITGAYDAGAQGVR